MSKEAAREATEAVQESTETEAAETPAEQENEATEELGDAGKKALDAERAARRAAEKAAKDAEAKAAREVAELKAKLEGREAEFEAEQKAQAIKDEALAATKKRILSAEIRAAAAGKLADPDDAVAFIDTTDFEVSDNGDVDRDAITEAISELLARKPHLAARSGTAVPPDPSQGARSSGETSIAQQFAAAFGGGL